MINTKEIRNNFRTSNIKLARARRLYIYLIRDKFDVYGNEFLDFIVDRMRECGLYAEHNYKRQHRLSIIGHLFKIDLPRSKKASTDYSRWLLKKGLDYHTGYYKPVIEFKENPKLTIGSGR